MRASRALAAALGIYLALAIAGCGGSGGDEELTPPTTATEAASGEATPAAPEPQTEVRKEPNQDPGDFIKALIERNSRGQHARVWEALHPAHKEIAPRSKFVECRNEAEVAGLELESVEILEVYDEPVTIPGQANEIESKAITYKITASVPLLDEPQSVTDTGHLIAVDGEWTWMLDAGHFEAYRAGTCPDTDE